MKKYEVKNKKTKKKKYSNNFLLPYLPPLPVNSFESFQQRHFHPNQERLTLQHLWYCEAENTRITLNETSSTPLKQIPLTKLQQKEQIYGILKKPKKKPSHTTNVINQVILLDKQYHESAIVIQRFWRQYIQKRFWIIYFHSSQAATQIQRILRGYLCRKLLRQWYTQRLKSCIKIQSLIRSFLTRLVLKTKQEWELYNIKRIQQFCKNYLKLQHFKAHKKENAVLKIQVRYRYYLRQRLRNRLILFNYCIKIQSKIRQYLTYKKYQQKKKIENAATTQIQKTFRRYQARLYVDELLYERETRNRQLLMKMLDSEIEYYQQEKLKYYRRISRSQGFDRVIETEEEYFQAREKILDLEAIYLDLLEQKSRVSPRAIEQGWTDELSQKIVEQREMITRSKFEAIFDIGLNFKRHHDFLIKQQEKISFYENKIAQLERWRNEEFLDYWQREKYHEKKRHDAFEARKIGIQRRKWKIQYFTKSGKIDLNFEKKKALQREKEAELLILNSDSDAKKQQAGNYFRQERYENLIKQLNFLYQQTSFQIQLEKENQFASLFNPFCEEMAQREKQVFDLINEALEKKKFSTLVTENNPEKSTAPISTTEAPINEKMSIVVPTPSKKVMISDEEREKRKRNRLDAAKVPWRLFDQLQVEREQLKIEKTTKKLFSRRFIEQEHKERKEEASKQT